MWLVSETGIIVILRDNCPIARLQPWSGQNPSGGGAALKSGGVAIAPLPHAGYGPGDDK